MKRYTSPTTAMVRPSFGLRIVGLIVVDFPMGFLWPDSYLSILKPYQHCGFQLGWIMSIVAVSHVPLPQGLLAKEYFIRHHSSCKSFRHIQKDVGRWYTLIYTDRHRGESVGLRMLLMRRYALSQHPIWNNINTTIPDDSTIVISNESRIKRPLRWGIPVFRDIAQITNGNIVDKFHFRNLEQATERIEKLLEKRE
jgi:hypothetical protein